MHILLGKYKGKKLLADEAITKPTTGKTKEALCSILYGRLKKAKVLDLFCGSGAVGFELLSSGAGELTGVDKDVRMAIKNAQTIGLTNASFFKNDCLVAIQKLAEKNEAFDIIFIDPPYDYAQKDDLLLAISNFDILAPEGVIVFETAKNTFFPEKIGQFCFIKEYRYGYSKLTLFEHINK
ncbi:MAG: 16S rRNA (guanine(966)-N(2))-methyltransferase RsmD [Candidatus Margulisbacteria bacterium]|nr:16S rRNA (guanine(966)-N(2))-methyltransferase RsmD [Candidatus Margulisiibacteriota bacterium]